MAENLSIKKSAVDSVLECPLCLHQLTLPQTLQQCLHSYCKSCLDNVPHKTQDGHQGWLCPLCEHFTKHDEVHQSYFIEQLQKINLKQCDQIKCQQCSDDCGLAIWKCAQCKIGLCENGKEVHLRIPLLKGHKVVPLASDREQLIDSIVFCKVHGGIPAQLNCRDCEQLICYTCNTTDHQGHKAETVEQALERFLPETESSARQIHVNIDIIEAHLDGVEQIIEQTRESHASLRMQMDDHLEKVICRMRAMKAQMEEDVNEQESIALDTLKELYQQLEKQLSQSRIISNLTAVVATKTRHTSLLQQLQTGLFEKVKSAGKIKKPDLCFKLPATIFIERQILQEDIIKFLGKLSFKTKEQTISISRESYRNPNQFLCSDFNKFAKTQFKKDKEIVVDAEWCNRLSYIDNKIWLPLHTRHKINIYDDDGELIDVIDTGDKVIAVVKAAHNGDIICAGDSGLFVTDTQFSKWTKLSKGQFCDVAVNNHQIIALQYDCPGLHTYSILKDVHGEESSWHECLLFGLTKDVMVNCNNSICLVEQYLLISSGSVDAKGLYKLTCEGKYLDSCKDLPFYPVICGIDKSYQVLVADFINGDMYLFKPLSEKEIQRNPIMSAVQTPQTRSVVIDQNSNLWVLVGDSNDSGFILIKFSTEH